RAAGGGWGGGARGVRLATGRPHAPALAAGDGRAGAALRPPPPGPDAPAVGAGRRLPRRQGLRLRGTLVPHRGGGAHRQGVHPPGRVVLRPPRPAPGSPAPPWLTGRDPLRLVRPQPASPVRALVGRPGLAVLVSGRPDLPRLPYA